MPRKQCIPIYLSEKAKKLFWSKILIKSNDECWTWTGSQQAGYGRFSIRRTTYKASRIAYLLHYNIDPEQLFVCHTCDNPPCVNPYHLFLGTIQDNNKDMVSKNRNVKGDKHPWRLNPSLVMRGDRNCLHTNPELAARGERNGSAKLTDIEVLAIRQEHATGKVSQVALAKKYKVGTSTIGRIVHNTHWKHVK